MAIRIGNDSGETLNTNVSSPADDFVWGAGGDDSIQTFDLDDEAHGGLGNDNVFGGNGDDLLFGYASPSAPMWQQFINFSLPSNFDDADPLTWSPDDPTFGGDDFITGGAGNDRIFGGGGNDTLFGSAAARQTGSGIDQINGGPGNDIIYGGDSNDVIDGGFNVPLSSPNGDTTTRILT